MTHKTPSKHTQSPLRHVSRELVARFGSGGSHLRTDDRAASAILGTMFAFALVVSVIAMVQVSAVPAWNQQTEFEHLQTVEGEFATFDERIAKASTGTPSRASLEAGVDYPTRALFLSPAAGSGTIHTTAPATATITNAQSVGSSAGYWNGDAREFDSQMLVYQPDYNYLQSDPALTHEGVARYTKYDSGEVGMTQSLVDGNRISLVLLEGDINVGAQDATTFSVVPVSAGTDYISVTDNGTPIQISLATRLSEASWNDLLASEPNAHVASYSTGANHNTVVVELAGGKVYDLHIARVGIDTPGEPQEPTYIVDIAGNGATLPPGASHLAVVEVRDAQNNPVVDAKVATDHSRVEARDTGSWSTFTDENGRATFVYTAPGSPDGIVPDSFDVYVQDADGTEIDRVTFDVETREGGPSSPDRGLIAAVDDPGQPFEDANGDRIYNAADGDVLVNASDVQDGTYAAASDKMLVIPPSVGTIVASEIDLSGGEGISLHVDLIATKNDITLDGGDGPIYAIGTRLTSASNNVYIETTDVVDLTGASIISLGDVEITADTGIDITRTGITSEKDTGVLTITSSGDIEASDADISGKGDVSVTGATVDLSGAGISSTKDTKTLEVTSTAGGINLVGVVMDGDGGISIESARSVYLLGGSLSSSKTGSDIGINAGTGISAVEVSIVAPGTIDIDAGTYVNVERATITANSDDSGNDNLYIVAGVETDKQDVDCTGASITPYDPDDVECSI
ncbi:hypothetical protein [Haloferax sp. DFSO52]|uniref:hypothetical protein n=1 Tax=Haloferax sp. DFSO52 TaxID=3388505 RepID=UPI003A8A77C0